MKWISICIVDQLNHFHWIDACKLVRSIAKCRDIVWVSYIRLLSDDLILYAIEVVEKQESYYQ